MKLIDVSTPKYPNTFAKVDDADYGWLNQWNWCAARHRNTIYASRTLMRGDVNRSISMHQAILKGDSSNFSDHIDGDGLNNQRANLRSCSNAQNQMNARPRIGGASRFKGVHFHARNKKYAANIMFYGKRKYLGGFDTEIEAALAYNEAAKIYHGEFARLNEVTPKESK